MKNIVEVTTGKIEYSIKGEGPVVLVLPGGHNNCQTAYPGRDFTTSGFTMLAVSRPGYGKTDISTGRESMSFADSLALLLNKLNINTVSVLGISAGGRTALNFTSKYPEYVDKLILQCALTQDQWRNQKRDEDYGKRSRIMFNPRIERITWGLLRVFSYVSPNILLTMMMDDLSTLNSKDLVKNMDNDYKKRVIAYLRQSKSEKGFILDIDHTVCDYSNIRCPTLLLYSSHDGVVDFSHARYALERIQTAKLVDVETDSHFIWFGPNSYRVEQELIAFLRQ
ncbi:MAG: alpha/beta hydrolase [Dehalococcoidia bacterium]|nr:MAG: alpha/beta hydrolase [Dehalococcoidia bacterium]